jgi:hypothetical protein
MSRKRTAVAGRKFQQPIRLLRGMPKRTLDLSSDAQKVSPSLKRLFQPPLFGSDYLRQPAIIVNNDGSDVFTSANRERKDDRLFFTGRRSLGFDKHLKHRASELSYILIEDDINRPRGEA